MNPQNTRGFLQSGVIIAAGLLINSAVFSATFTVINTNNSGVGSLRQAIIDANAAAGTDTIAFDIPGAGPHTISLQSPLPFIAEAVILNGLTQPGASCDSWPPTLAIVLDGSSAGSGNGLVLSEGGSGSTIRGLVIHSFDLEGIALNNSDNNIIQCNFIGTDVTGTQDLGSVKNGVRLFASSNNTVGGMSSKARNLISGNDFSGIAFNAIETTGNIVQGNFIGTDVTGTLDLGNSRNGIWVDEAPNNLIGGTADGAGNLISGNDWAGLTFLRTATGNLVQGNFIGTDVNGAASIGNDGQGISIVEGASDNIIGGTAPGARNLLSGNAASGVAMTQSSTTGNQVLGNFIGTDVSGTLALPNSAPGVHLFFGASNNIIGGTASGARNIISGNGSSGIQIRQEGVGNQILGNFIGTDVTGLVDLGNTGSGIVISSGASNNTIGGATEGARNVISSNGGIGVFLFSGATANSVLGNFIGTDINGNINLGNQGSGIQISSGASSNVVGGIEPGTGNIVSGNRSDGIVIRGVNSNANMVFGNLIGTDITGTVRLGNAQMGVHIFDSASNNTIGGPTTGARNVISGNGGDGVGIGGGSTGNIVLGNFIGTDVTGTIALGNSDDGVGISGGAEFNSIGGSTSGERNIISGNGTRGIWIIGSNNTISGNYVGTDATGTIDLGNSRAGVKIEGSNNTIGGTTAGVRNIVSGNGWRGIRIYLGTGNIVQGNFIGTDVTGTVALRNDQHGLVLDRGTSNNTIGGTVTGAGNVISGNNWSGILINAEGTDNNLVQGNFIGTDVTGTVDIGNIQNGILIENDASNNLIGGTGVEARNTIAFNGLDGIRVISGTRNAILSNAIFSNTTQGIDIGNNGVTANDPGDADSGANNLQNFPEIVSSYVDSESNWSLQYHVDSDPANSVYELTVQFFESDPNGQGRAFLFLDQFSVTDFSNGMKSLDLGNAANLGILAGSRIVATATDANGNTSEFSAIAVVDTALTFVVNSIGDRGDSNPGDDICDDGLGNCTLRAALEEANAGTAPDTIAFDISGSGPHTIRPATALPTITVPVVIDGATEPDYAGMPVIELDGTSAGASVDGLHITAGNSTVKGLVINRFKGDGIEMRTNGGNVVQGNFIGTDVTGTADLGNAFEGVFINGVANNTIGGTTTGDRNLISGNAHGVFMQGSAATGNLVQGNFIGTDVNGAADLGNSISGVTVTGGANTTIGGTATGAGNVISGNDFAGVNIFGGSGHVVQGNYIGTDVTGTATIPNSAVGLTLQQGVTSTTIGGTEPGASNLISGNGNGNEGGVSILGNSHSNFVQGNNIGTDVTGTVDLGNAGPGVLISLAQNNTIGGIVPGSRNLISGNAAQGIRIQGTSSANNFVQGNFIGTDVTGTASLGNDGEGVFIDNAPNNTIGGATVEARNLISANGLDGVNFFRSNAKGNLVQGNYIGTEINGTADLGNGRDGVRFDGAPENTVGGIASGPGEPPGNLISGNERFGVFIVNSGAFGNVVQGNLIGTDVTGKVSIANAFPGVSVTRAANTLIGGTSAGAGNVISGNLSHGVEIQDEGATGNIVVANFIGTDVSGSHSLGNAANGVYIDGAAGNVVGGTSEGARNIISGNREGVRIEHDGADGNEVLGNYIGTNVTGTDSLGNVNGIIIFNGATDNIIGGTEAGSGNLISGNRGVGIAIGLGGANGNIVRGNYVGTDATGEGALGNSSNGIAIFLEANDNLIGGGEEGAGNIIAFNAGVGVLLDNPAPTVRNTISRNSIYSNGGIGIDLSLATEEPFTDGVTPNDPGDADTGPNNLQNFPEIFLAGLNADGDLVLKYHIDSDPANSDYALTVEFFVSDSSGEGKTFLGEDVFTETNFADGFKVTNLSDSLGLAFGDSIVATATDASGNTSEFSAIIQVQELFVVVNSTGDDGDSNPGDLLCDDGSGSCTLRAAIEEANAGAGKDSIAFDIPGEGPHTIQPVSALPLIHDPVVIDGSTQPGYAGTPIVELDGSNAPNANGIWISAGAENSVVRGLMINRFAEAGIHLGASGGHIIEGNYIGTDVSGTQALGNTIGVWILNNSSNNLIGGKSPGAGNLVSGNNESGIDIREAGSTGNIVQGNFIGTDKTGTTALPNLIVGVRISDAANNNTIGGTTPGAGNLISGNSKQGLLIEGSAASNNIVQGNYVGTDVSGTTAIANGEEGVTIMAASDNLIGGTTPEARNVISGNGENGIKIVEGEASGNQVLGNYIGIQADGASPLGNGRHGVAIGLSAKNNIVGGAGVTPGQCDGPCNKIAFNGQSPGFDGVRILDGTGNTILGNAIFANSDLGIDLGVSDITENDPADPDTGPNNLQNFPAVTDVGLIDNGDLVFQYSVDSDPNNAAYPLTIQFFASDAGGEGMRFLGDDIYTLANFNNGAKFANLGSASALEIGPDESVVTTATDSSGNTSEFSPMKMVGTITSVAQAGDNLPAIFLLHQNYPNPFNPETVIRFELPETGDVTLKIYNVQGQEIRTLVDENLRVGIHSLVWDGKDANGKSVATGIYLYRIQAGDFSGVRKMTLIR